MFHVESNKKPATTASWNVAFDFGRYSSESFAKPEDLMDHYGDGVRRRHISPIASDGGTDEPGKIGVIMILIGTSNVSKSSDAEEAQWESRLVCLFTPVWQNFSARY